MCIAGHAERRSRGGTELRDDARGNCRDCGPANHVRRDPPRVPPPGA